MFPAAAHALRCMRHRATVASACAQLHVLARCSADTPFEKAAPNPNVMNNTVCYSEECFACSRATYLLPARGADRVYNGLEQC